MTTKTLTILAVVAVVLIAVAALVFQRKDATLPQTGQPVFPGLMAAINDVSEMSVSTQSGTITILRGDDAWRVKEKHDYPADMGKVREALVGLAELKILEPKTGKPEFHEKLGLRDIDAEGSLSTGVTLKDAAGNVLAEIIVGHDRPAKGNPDHKEVFIRKPGNPQTWLAMGKLLVEKNPGEWLDKDLVRVEPERVRRLRVLYPDKTRLVLEKAQPADLDYQVVNLPEGLEIQSQFTVNNVVSTVTSLSLDDVKPRSEIPFDEQPFVTAVFETFDGLQGTVQLLQKDEKHYVKVSAAFNADLIRKPEPEKELDATEESRLPAAEQTEAAARDQEATADPEQPKIKPEADVKAEIEALNKKVAGWVYVIPKFRADAILKKPQDLLKTSDS